MVHLSEAQTCARVSCSLHYECSISVFHACPSEVQWTDNNWAQVLLNVKPLMFSFSSIKQRLRTGHTQGHRLDPGAIAVSFSPRFKLMGSLRKLLVWKYLNCCLLMFMLLTPQLWELGRPYFHFTGELNATLPCPGSWGHLPRKWWSQHLTKGVCLLEQV